MTASMRFVWLWAVVTCLAVTVSLAGLSSLVEAESGTAPLVTVGTAENPPTSATSSATTTAPTPVTTAPIADPPPDPPPLPRGGGRAGGGDDDDDD
ncbi:hypothetical protein ADK67_29870 [Saccharothrix sp. NRRL B-16348]|nr:hypothetical protein ADK67_29870 [Saccharothrix sp. NRRL B-16348]